MNVVYLSPRTRRSRTIIGIPFSKAALIIGVSGAASLGETIIASTPALINSSICATCFNESFCASLKITFSSGCFPAALLMSSFICTRHGSPRLHWLIPITFCFAAGLDSCVVSVSFFPHAKITSDIAINIHSFVFIFSPLVSCC